MAGPDECGWRAELERLAARLGVHSRVVWTGPLYGAVKQGALGAADVLALPSHTENFGISVVEAMACGVPVLVSNEVNIWREIESDGAGLAAPPDVEGITALLRSLACTSRRRRVCRMRTNAARSFSRRYELEHFARGFIRMHENGVTAVDLSVVIVNHNHRPVIENCFASLFSLPDRATFEVTLIDNACTDGTAQWVATRYPQVVIRRNQTPLGFAANANAGMRVLDRGRYALLLNPDVICHSRFVGPAGDLHGRAPARRHRRTPTLQ